jgi:hypothetical protein
VLEVGIAIAPAAGDGEEFFEMLALAVIDDVENGFGMPGFVAKLDCGQIAGGVEKRAVLLLDDHGRVKAFDEDDDSTLAVFGEAFFAQVFDDGGQPIVIEAFAVFVVERDVQPAIDSGDFVAAVGQEFVPELEILGVIGVKPGGLLEDCFVDVSVRGGELGKL